jgi:hypothetical protein
VRCTKCSGSGSEGFISFLRCGRCGGSGDEPADALIPYSDELIVVPDSPVLTQALKEEAEVVKKKLAEASEKEEQKKEGWPAFAGVGEPPSSQRPSGRSSYTYGIDNQSFNDCPAPEEKKPYIQPISMFFDLKLEAEKQHGLDFSFLNLCQDFYSQELFLHEIGFDSKDKYMVKILSSGCIILEAFYTGLGVKAVIDGQAKVNPHHGFRIELESQNRNPTFPEDRIAVTAWIEKREAASMIQRPNFGTYRAGHSGCGPSYGTR